MKNITVGVDTDVRPATKAANYGGNQVDYFARLILAGRPIMPHGYPVTANYLTQQESTRVEFSPVPPASRPLLEMGQVA